ncbi:hypothetical protein PSACC_02422 [Paramicrosporidium saccamoebae]|uniref:TAFII55 protein conserved region domain-containing protein n=1 Tax=Paramicrosporidium saccamoebae TaxID=1246581 RepID=A0A2H9TJ22_9FUNG|nr:hypothetical protein PSACC_02422 [Paramicrosporidium saccamoebae]
MTDGTASQMTLKIRIGGLVESPPFPYTYEEQFILRFPPSVAAELREELRESSQPDDLSITFTDTRRAQVSFHGRMYVGVLVDLPTILETHRTFDRSQYYKTADICQMLLVMPDGPETQAKIQHYEANGWQHPDGLTPPLKDVRTRRFSRTASYGKQKDVEAIEKRVQALLDRDTAAASSSFTIYDSMGKTLLVGGATDGKFEPPEEGKEEDEEESDDEFAAELEEAMLAEDAMEVETQTESAAPIEDGGQEMPAEEQEAPTPEPPMPVQSTAVKELQAKIDERKAQLASVTNPMIKARLADVIRQLEEDLYSRL